MVNRCFECGHEIHDEICKSLDAAGSKCGCNNNVWLPTKLIEITPDDESKKYGYRYSMKIPLDQTMRTMIEVLEADGEITLTYPDGKKKRLKLEDV